MDYLARFKRQVTKRSEDIQVLRGAAVSLVVLFHSGVVPVPAGYLGVDVFFVISGFLITSHIVSNIDRQTLSITQFYMRRVRRLLPATYSTLSVTTLGAFFFLPPSSWEDYIKSLFGALTFTANIFLWLQTGYFEEAAASKPLLHLWSLSIEEQYYLFLPLFLIIAPKGWRVFLIGSALLSSAALCILIVPYKASSAFFLLPTRAWELMIGSLLAEQVAIHPTLKAPSPLKYAATAVILLVPIFPIDEVHPRLDAILVSCATAILLIGHGRWLSLGLFTRILSTAGDWSYSIYLVHWPLFAFATNAFLGNIPTTVALILIPASFGLGYVQYRYIEQPFRFVWRENNIRYLRYVVVASLIVFLPVPLYLFNSTVKPTDGVDFKYLRRVNFGLDPVCEYEGSIFANRPQCKLPGDPRVALWGDSFAMQWAAGLADALHGKGLVQITKSVCAPIANLAAIDADHTRQWATTCMGFNNSALHYITTSKSIETVALSSAWVPLGPGVKGFLIGNTVEPPSVGAVRGWFLDTISILQQAGKHFGDHRASSPPGEPYQCRRLP